MSAKLLEVLEEAKAWWAGEWLEVPGGRGVRRTGIALAMPGWELLSSDQETPPQVNWPDFRMGQSRWRGKKLFQEEAMEKTIFQTSSFL